MNSKNADIIFYRIYAMKKVSNEKKNLNAQQINWECWTPFSYFWLSINNKPLIEYYK